MDFGGGQTGGRCVSRGARRRMSERSIDAATGGFFEWNNAAGRSGIERCEIAAANESIGTRGVRAIAEFGGGDKARSRQQQIGAGGAGDYAGGLGKTFRSCDSSEPAAGR